MAEFDQYRQKQHTSRLKLFGYNISEDHSTSPDSSKYECQYCYREFVNSRALGGHQNAHRKERKQLKRSQMHATRNNAVFKNSMVSAFAPPKHLLVPPSSTCATPQFNVVHGGTFGGSRGAGRMGVYGDTIVNSMANYDTTSLSRFSKGDGNNGFDDGLGLDLHLSLTPAAP